MFLLSKPSSDVVERFIASQEKLPFTYSQTGATLDLPERRAVPASKQPRGIQSLPGFTVDHNRVKLGEGKEIYERAVTALQRWRQFELGWLTIVPAGAPVSVGTTVAVRAHTFGLWSLSAARIVYLIEEDEEVKRFGFAYGTLPDHVECGEERFTVEWHTDDSVWYDLCAFSRPRHPLARMAFPLTRRLQRRFAKESLAAMAAGCSFPSPQKAGRG